MEGRRNGRKLQEIGEAAKQPPGVLLLAGPQGFVRWSLGIKAIHEVAPQTRPKKAKTHRRIVETGFSPVAAGLPDGIGRSLKNESCKTSQDCRISLDSRTSSFFRERF